MGAVLYAGWKQIGVNRVKWKDYCETIKSNKILNLKDKFNAARQWSILVWALSDDTREISEDASELTREIIILVRSLNYQETSDFKIFVKESAKREERKAKNDYQ